jgi:hypothetical protein
MVGVSTCEAVWQHADLLIPTLSCASLFFE